MNRRRKFPGFSFTMVRSPQYVIFSLRRRPVFSKNQVFVCGWSPTNMNILATGLVCLYTRSLGKRRIDQNTAQRMHWCIYGIYRPALRTRPQSHRLHFRTSLAKTNEISPVWIGAPTGNSWLLVQSTGVCACARHPRSLTWIMLNIRSVYGIVMVCVRG